MHNTSTTVTERLQMYRALLTEHIESQQRYQVAHRQRMIEAEGAMHSLDGALMVALTAATFDALAAARSEFDDLFGAALTTTTETTETTETAGQQPVRHELERRYGVDIEQKRDTQRWEASIFNVVVEAATLTDLDHALAEWEQDMRQDLEQRHACTLRRRNGVWVAHRHDAPAWPVIALDLGAMNVALHLAAMYHLWIDWSDEWGNYAAFQIGDTTMVAASRSLAELGIALQRWEAGDTDERITNREYARIKRIERHYRCDVSLASHLPSCPWHVHAGEHHTLIASAPDLDHLEVALCLEQAYPVQIFWDEEMRRYDAYAQAGDGLVASADDLTALDEFLERWCAPPTEGDGEPPRKAIPTPAENVRRQGLAARYQVEIDWDATMQRWVALEDGNPISVVNDLDRLEEALAQRERVHISIVEDDYECEVERDETVWCVWEHDDPRVTAPSVRDLHQAMRLATTHSVRVFCAPFPPLPTGGPSVAWTAIDDTTRAQVGVALSLDALERLVAQRGAENEGNTECTR